MNDQTTQPPPPPQAQMLQILSGFWVSRTIYVAATLGLADLVHQKPQAADELAKATESHPRAMYRLMRALASVGIFREDESGKFHNTELSSVLRTGTPDSLRATAMSELGMSHYGAWGEILHGIKTNKPSFDKVFNVPVFEWFGKHPEKAKLFQQSMSELTALVEPTILEAYDFSHCGTILDVGGGVGSLLSAILKKHANLRGIVFDREEVVALAPPKLKESGLSDRCTTLAGDFFKTVPAGGDTYIMKHIIHDWNDEQCQTILKHCHKVMKPGAKVLIVDQVLPGRNEPSLGKFSDILMMLMPGGMERTADEFRELLKASGFELSRIVPTKSLVSIVEGVKK